MFFVELALFYEIIRIFMRFPYDGEKPRSVSDSRQFQRLPLLHQAYRQFPASYMDGVV